MSKTFRRLMPLATAIALAIGAAACSDRASSDAITAPNGGAVRSESGTGTTTTPTTKPGETTTYTTDGTTPPPITGNDSTGTCRGGGLAGSGGRC